MLYIFWINSWYKDCFRNERHKRFEEEYPRITSGDIFLKIVTRLLESRRNKYRRLEE